MAETRHIVAGNQLIYHAIYSQAGSLEKALLENIMNSVDAAADSVQVTLDETHFVVTDNGAGLNRMEDIERFFDALGFDHGDPDNQIDSRQYGKFGLGRAQNFAFARTIWRTGPFRMDVDVRNRGLDYNFEDGLEDQSGCVITGYLYHELKPSNVYHAVRMLTDMVRYMPIAVHINGERVNQPVEDHKWDMEDDYAYYQFTDKGSLAIYNLGAKVTEVPASRYGTGGVIVSKQPLALNTARTEILESTCTVWPEIKKVVSSHVRSQAKKKPKMNESMREHLAQQFIDGEIEYEEVKDSRLITYVTGQHVQLKTFLGTSRFTVAPEANDRIGEKLHKTGTITVVHPNTLSRFGVDSGNELVERLENVNKLTWPVPAHELFDLISRNIDDTHELIEDKKLSGHERAALKALRSAQGELVLAFNRRPEGGHISCFSNDFKEERQLKAGESDTAAAWTNGETYIAIERRQLRAARTGISGITQLALLLLHEYCHDDSNVGGHNHDQAFFEQYEAIANHGCSYQMGGVGPFVDKMLSHYASELEYEGRKLSKTILNNKDRAARVEHAASKLNELEAIQEAE